MNRRFAVGIDLHGTLLDKGWKVPPSMAHDLAAALVAVGPVCELYLCTGNDLTFLYDHLDDDLLALFHGFVLETGCVVGRDGEEEVLVPDEALARMKDLERRLRHEEFGEVRYFARRLATISMFTKTEGGGTDPAGIFPLVSRRVVELGFGSDVLVTHSDVAVDIIPAGFNKFKGLRLASEAPVLVGIADSLNDLHLVRDAQLAFLPANASPALLAALEAEGREVVALEEQGPLTGGTIAMASSRHTKAVIESLHLLGHHLGQ